MSVLFEAARIKSAFPREMLSSSAISFAWLSSDSSWKTTVSTTCVCAKAFWIVEVSAAFSSLLLLILESKETKTILLLFSIIPPVTYAETVCFTAFSTLCFSSEMSRSAFSASLLRKLTSFTVPFFAIVYSTLGLTSSVNAPAVAWLERYFAVTTVHRIKARQAAIVPNLNQTLLWHPLSLLSASAIRLSSIFPIAFSNLSVFIA